MSAKRVKTLVSQELDAEVIALQECPKQEAGWQLVKGETWADLSKLLHVSRSGHLL